MRVRRPAPLADHRPTADAPSPRPVGGLPGVLLGLQRTAGNRSAAAWVEAGRIVQRDGDGDPASTGAAAKGSLFDGKGLVLGDPEQFLRERPSLAPSGGLPTLPPDAVSGLIDWGDVGTAYADRRLVLQPRDRAIITDHYRRWYPVAQALYRLPLAARLFDSPAAIMNTMTAKMIDASLAGSNLNMFEQFDREAARFGGSSTGASVTVKRF